MTYELPSKPQLLTIRHAGMNYTVGFYRNPYPDGYDNIWWLIKPNNWDGRVDHSRIVGRGALHAVDLILDEQTLDQFTQCVAEWPSWVTDPGLAKCNPRYPHVNAYVQDDERSLDYDLDIDEVPVELRGKPHLEKVDRMLMFTLCYEPEDGHGEVDDFEHIVLDSFWQYWEGTNYHAVRPHESGTNVQKVS